MYGEGNAAMISAMGKKYEMVMTVAKILAVATGLLVSCSFRTQSQSRVDSVRGI